MSTTVERWLVAALELFERRAADRALLGEAFLAGRDIGGVTGVEAGLSDPHREGRGVVVLTFGSGLRLVYKPKSLAVDERFQELLRWLNGETPRYPHRVLTVLDRGTYGWVEFVEFSGCASREALQRFYWRQGSFLALLHLLSAVDFHQENLIAAGEDPVLVDLEALFHHRLPIEPGDSAHERVVRRQGTTAGSHDRPMLGGEAVDPTGFIDDIVQGFEETCGMLMTRRDALAPRLQAFAGVEVREVLERLAAMDPRECARQGGLIRKSMTTLAKGRAPVPSVWAPGLPPR